MKANNREIILVKKESGVAFLLLDCPGKVNMLSSRLMHELAEAISVISEDPLIRSLVILSGKKDTFIVGADLHEIRRAESMASLYDLSRQGQAILNKIAQLSKPTIVAIHGQCLGGGLELALSCHYRIATDHNITYLGLPETKLGIIPGLGGSQRLPKLIGLKDALAMILSAEPIPAKQAKEIGLVDELIADDDLMSCAEHVALQLVAKDPVIKSKNTCNDSIPLTMDAERTRRLFAIAEKSLLTKVRKNYPAQIRAIEVMKKGLTDGMEAGLEAEARAFSELAKSEISANLVSLYFVTDFAKQSAKAMADILEGDAVKTIAVVGSGIMGIGIACLAAVSGLNVLIRSEESRMGATMERVQTLLKRLVHKANENIDLALSRIRGISKDTGLAEADLIMETVVEDFDAKVSVLRRIDQNLKQGAIVVSNTSSLSLSQLASFLNHNDRFLGMHFFNPVEKMPLVEIICHATTSKLTIAKAASLTNQLHKIPLKVSDSPGFLINRLLSCYLLEAARMAESGIPLNWLEEAALEFGMPIGPLELMDEIGLDTAFKVAYSLHEALGSRIVLPPILERVQELKILGKKAGAGVYLWDQNGKRDIFNPELSKCTELKIVTEHANEPTKKNLADRLIFPMLDEAARCLEENVVKRAREIDMAVVLGIGFPPFRGGLLKYADKIGMQETARLIKKAYLYSGNNREVSSLITKFAKQGRGFYFRTGTAEEDQ